ncbi:staphylococcal nuclease domain-containing protein 1 [Diorhabda sublineata]|uniref:staphylococcal nuclease domain-containing protein 1 n=1 Tax=Diorhabda sublineata TaxID=1163346 RepID=UPI0024E11521|nr:staphylococcal nuclease domain-containing protein 1 [Diorhabda sublineata]
MTTQQTTTIKPIRGIIKQILSGDSVIIRAQSGAPPPEKQINFSSITAPKLARRAGDIGETTKDEPWAWEAREFLRKKLIGEEVFFTFEKPPNAVREYGVVYLGKDFNTAENITETLVSEGLVTVRDAARPTPEQVRLLELQEAAKSAGKGMWGGAPPSEHVRDIKWVIEEPKDLVDQLQFKPIKAIIEHVRDGSTVRAFLLPDFYYITLMISGIRCPGFKLDANGKRDPLAKVEYAEEARYFVELRLLQRDVEIVLEAVNNNNFIGTIIHPKGNIAELLLKEGLAKCVDWSIMLMKSSSEKLRAAEKQAKEARRRLWKDFVPTMPKITGKEKEFTAVVSEINNGDAIVLKMPNGDYKKVFLASIRAPKEPGRANDDEGKPVPRPKGFRPLYDIPYMFEAREYLRKKLIGKKVHVVIDYVQEAREGFPEKVCATVTIGGKNVAEALVSKGLATVVRYRQDDDQRSCRYDELLTAEAKASKSQVGLHGKKDAPPLRVIEIDAARAKLELAALQRAQRIDAIVEFVASGSRLRLYIPKSNSLCTFLLGGITCQRATRQATDTPGEPYGDEALLFTKERCMQREVSIQVDTHDKAGNFIGWLWVDNVNMSVALVKEGFASVHFTGEKSQYASLLKSAEDSAKAQKLRIWKNYVEVEKEEKQEEEKVPIERQINFEEVVVTEVTPEGNFYVQRISEGPKVEALFAKLRQEFEANPPLPGAYTPKRGDICAAKFTVDDDWYRVKVEKVQGGKATVHYIDYGNKEILPTTRLASLPAAYISEKSFATEYVLPFVVLPKDEEFASTAIKYLKEDTAVSKLYLNVEYRQPGSPPAASLHSDKTSDSDIVKNLIKEGLLIVENVKGRRHNKLLESYKEAQEIAKKQHANIWEYGDISEVDAKEFGLGN